jgi:hypothetical protein
MSCRRFNVLEVSVIVVSAGFDRLLLPRDCTLELTQLVMPKVFEVGYTIRSQYFHSRNIY